MGVGSVGKTHLQHLTHRFDKVTLIDPKIEEVKKVLETQIGTHIEFKKSIKEISSVNRSTLVVIANWGPNHYEVFKYFTKLGIKKFLIEKPVVDSLKDMSSMKKYQEKAKEILHEFPDSEARNSLFLMLDYVIERKH